VTIDSHPILADLITGIRDVQTSPDTFSALVDRAASLLLVTATADLATVTGTVETPMESTTCRRVAVRPLIVPILRAGLGMLGAATRLLPESGVALVGLRRDERTAQASWYLDALPSSLASIPVLVLEPMIATGGTLRHVIARLDALGADSVTVVSLLCAPEGVEVLRQASADLTCEVHIVAGAEDRCLNSRHFIVPGLGDAGDRLFSPG
jgi:uracil phosphoribosyltransferase